MTTWRTGRATPALEQAATSLPGGHGCPSRRRGRGPLFTASLVGALLVAGAPPVHGASQAPVRSDTAAAAVAPPSGSPGSPRDGASTYRLPVEGTVLRLFDPPPVRWAAGHRGVDLAAGPGDAVLAPSDGVVTFAGTVVDRGVLTVTHPDGRRSSFEPVEAVVAVGQVVAAGAVVATVAPEPVHCTSTCVHWGVREGEEYVDPLSLLPGAGPVVLLG